MQVTFDYLKRVLDSTLTVTSAFYMHKYLDAFLQEILPGSLLSFNILHTCRMQSAPNSVFSWIHSAL